MKTEEQGEESTAWEGHSVGEWPSEGEARFRGTAGRDLG